MTGRVAGLLVALILAIVANKFVAAECNLLCVAGQTCYATSTDAMSCLQSIPFNQTWAEATVDVISQSLENFGFKALYHNTGPPYSIMLDIDKELEDTSTMITNGDFTTDLDFQEHLQSIIQKTIDAHTRYQKPACYNTIFVQPFAFDMRVEDSDSEDNEPSVYLMRNLYTDLYSNTYASPAYPDPAAVIGKKVILLNGVELTTEVASWGDSHETRSNNPGIRFNAAIRSYLYRSAISVNVVPLQDLIITLEDGSEYTFPWLASYTTGLADLSLCAALPADAAEGSFLGPSHDGVLPDILEHAQPLVKAALHDLRPDREVIVSSDSAYPLTCFVQTVRGDDAKVAKVSRVLVMKVSSFSPDGFYLDAWAGFLNNAKQCLSSDYDMIVVDVMQNGGGYVCLGLRLLELLVEDYYKDHTAVQMNYDLPHSSLMDTYIEVVNAPDPYPYPQDVEQILDKATQQAFPDGRAYYYPGRNVTQGGVVSWRTNFFSLNCTQAEAMPSLDFRPSKFLPPNKLIIMTDGTCGSTCASFTKIPQEAGKATFVGIGGIWDEGMDVSSFAGGFVCNPSYLQNIATWSGITFPKFLTNQRWQFGWAAWYSAKLPTRPVQFTVQDPDYREAFWGFPHPSINSTVTSEMVSVLYDRVIDSSLSRLAVSAPSSDDCPDSDGDLGVVIALILVSVLLFMSLLTIGYLFYRVNGGSKYGVLSSEEKHEPLQRTLMTA